jgi:hypothetical protein
MTHDPFPGLGCRECDCLEPRELAYRRAIMHERHLVAEALGKRRKVERILRFVFTCTPPIMRAWLREELWMRLRGTPRN